MKRLLVLMAGVFLAGASACPSDALAQAQTDTLVWEQVGTLLDVQGLFFDGDTLYAAAVGDPVQVFRPGDGDFSQAFPSNAYVKDLLILPARAIFSLTSIGASGGYRSTDWGQTWQETHEDAFTLPVPTPEDALVLGTRGSAADGGRLAARSADNGATWTSHGLGDGTDGLGTTSLVVIPPSPDRPAGRLVATGYGGIAYSDDDGRSWSPTALYGGLAYASWSSARIPAGSHAGRLLAVVERGQPGGSPTGLYASSDGATWTRIGAVPGGGARGVRLLAAPDGAVYAYQSSGDEKPIWRSTDGGVSWVNLGPVWTAWPAEVSEVVVGPEGRLWAACSGGGFAGYDGGVFRTVLPAVSSEEGSEPGAERPVVEVGAAYPNPSSEGVTVPLVLSSSAEVRVAVYDVLGREVAVLTEGPMAAGHHALALETAALPAGVYLVRLEARAPGREVAQTRRLTLVR